MENLQSGDYFGLALYLRSKPLPAALFQECLRRQNPMHTFTDDNALLDSNSPILHGRLPELRLRFFLDLRSPRITRTHFETSVGLRDVVQPQCLIGKRLQRGVVFR